LSRRGADLLGVVEPIHGPDPGLRGGTACGLKRAPV
jgi:hypothetical protein